MVWCGVCVVYAWVCVCMRVCVRVCVRIHKHTYTYTHVLTFLSLSQWGFTALLRAAYNGHAELVRMLLQEFSCSLDEVENVSVCLPMCSTIHRYI